ncbi:TOBE domain-containing protein, partial [Natrinema soli]
DAVARVGIGLENADGGDGGSDTELVALVTRRSVETLGLEPGRSIVASVKATAARGVGIEDRSQGNSGD